MLVEGREQEAITQLCKVRAGWLKVTGSCNTEKKMEKDRLQLCAGNFSVYKKRKNIPDNVWKIKAVALMYMQSIVLKASTAQALHSFVQDAHFRTKASSFKINSDGLSLPPRSSGNTYKHSASLVSAVAETVLFQDKSKQSQMETILCLLCFFSLLRIGWEDLVKAFHRAMTSPTSNEDMEIVPRSPPKRKKTCPQNT